MELVRVFELADVEFGLEGADVGLGAAGGAVAVVVVEEAEDGGEVVLGEAGKERHCVWVLVSVCDVFVN